MIPEVMNRIIAGGLAIGVGFAGGWVVRGWLADADLLALRGTFDRAVIAAQEDARADERRMQAEINEIAVGARNASKEIDLAAGYAGVVSDGVQQAASAYASAATCDPGVADRGKAATQAAMVLSDMLGVCSATATRVAESAERFRVAGESCERAYDALTK